MRLYADFFPDPYVEKRSFSFSKDLSFFLDDHKLATRYDFDGQDEV